MPVWRVVQQRIRRKRGTYLLKAITGASQHAVNVAALPPAVCALRLLPAGF
jgi:hypothetical protein